jgi:hypothetical protein
MKDNPISLSIPVYALMGEGCNFKILFGVSEFECNSRAHKCAVSEPATRSIRFLVSQSDNLGFATAKGRQKWRVGTVKWS